jgi:receptor protein-tyrosine kinase
MNLVEQATKRLQELQRAGINMPWRWTDAAHPEAVVLPRPGLSLSADDTGGRAQAEAQQRAADAFVGKSTVAIDLPRLEAMGYVVPRQPRSETSEEFRHIKRQLLRNVRAAVATGPEGAGRSKLVMLTSALPAEGKTFCAVNLAMCIAMEVDTSVLLVDADVVRPSLFARLGLPPREGLMDWLCAPQRELSELVVQTNVPKLSLLSAGKPQDNANELLSSAAMESLLARMAQHKDDLVVVFDSPPLLLTAESRLLAGQMGQVVVVVEAGRTTEQSILQAFAAAEQCPQVMGVLNRCDASFRPYGYGYGYDY